MIAVNKAHVWPCKTSLQGSVELEAAFLLYRKLFLDIEDLHIGIHSRSTTNNIISTVVRQPKAVDSMAIRPELMCCPNCRNAWRFSECLQNVG